MTIDSHEMKKNSQKCQNLICNKIENIYNYLFNDESLLFLKSILSSLKIVFKFKKLKVLNIFLNIYTFRKKHNFL